MIASCNNCVWYDDGICETDNKKVNKNNCCGAWLKNYLKPETTIQNTDNCK